MQRRVPPASTVAQGRCSCLRRSSTGKRVPAGRPGRWARDEAGALARWRPARSGWVWGGAESAEQPGEKRPHLNTHAFMPTLCFSLHFYRGKVRSQEGREGATRTRRPGPLGASGSTLLAAPVQPLTGGPGRGRRESSPGGVCPPEPLRPRGRLPSGITTKSLSVPTKLT